MTDQIEIAFSSAPDESLTEQRFQSFHRDNPIVYATLVRLARYARKRGRVRIGIRMLWERMRWELSIETHDATSDYKLNDHYTSRYARLLDRCEPDLRGMFEIRTLRS